MKKKKAIVSIKKINKSDNDITRVDQNTFYHKASNPDDEPYMIFYSQNEGWLCDCMNWTLNVKDNNNVEPYECKHIIRCKALGN